MSVHDEEMTMITVHDTMTDATRRGQEAFTGVLQIWADSLEKLAPNSDAKVHRAVELVDKTFDFYHHVLACQQEFIKSWLAITASAATKVASAELGAARDLARGLHEVAREAGPKRDTYDGVHGGGPE
jgi:hypothetical protein